MAVHTNSQQVQLKSVSTSNAVIVTNTLPATVQTLSSNGLIHAILPSTTVKGDASKQVQLRVVSTPQTGSSNKLNQMQPPVVRLIKASNRVGVHILLYSFVLNVIFCVKLFINFLVIFNEFISDANY